MKALDNIYKVFDNIKARRAMYLGNGYSFQSLDSFVMGYRMAANKPQLQPPGMPNFNHFNTWLLGHLDKNYGLSGGWFWQISNRNPNNDLEAFDDFFCLLDIFKNSRLESKSITVNDAARKFSANGPIKHYLNYSECKVPCALRWQSITNSKTIWIDFLDENNRAIGENWYLNEEEANTALQKEFGGYLDKF